MPSPNPGLSPASADLGLGDQLAQQVQGETEDERKKRMALMQQQKMLGQSGSMAVTALFGPGTGVSGGGV
jgi:hypothetical protein